MSPSRSIPSWVDWLSIGALAFGSLISLGILDLAPRDTRSDVAVVFAPWVRSADASTRAAVAGATLVRAGGYPFIIIVRPTSADYMARVLRAGALAVFDSAALSGCQKRSAGLT